MFWHKNTEILAYDIVWQLKFICDGLTPKIRQKSFLSYAFSAFYTFLPHKITKKRFHSSVNVYYSLKINNTLKYVYLYSVLIRQSDDSLKDGAE